MKSISKNKGLLSASANASGILTSALTTWAENFSTSQTKLTRDLHSHLRLMVPEQGDRNLHSDNTTGFNLIKTDMDPQILSLVLYLMSNNMMKEDGTRKVVEYFKHNSGKRFLRLALSIKASTIEAFAERLFVAAVRSEDIEIVYILLSYGVDPSRWSYLYTPLICVLQRGNSELAQLLINFGADVNADEYGRTALQAAAKQGNIELVRILLDAGADVNAPPADEDGRTALQAAAKEGNIELVRILLDAGADVNALSAAWGWTALQAAAEKGNIELVRILLDAGADVNALPAEGCGATALQNCVIRGFFKIAMVLLDAGADVNAPGSCINGRTALEGGAEQGRIDIVQWLLNAGADVTGSRAPQLALSQGYYAVKKIIESHSMAEAMET
jgi:ankyrin repeat protein